MSGSAKKQTFLHGAALLAIATAVVKVIGALYKIPLKMVIGDAGYGYFMTAYNIYSVLLMISTAGLPVAMSRMVSQAASLGHYNQVRKVYRTARGIFLGLGVVSSLLMVVFCRQLAAFQRQPDAWAAIAILGPCALLMGIISTYRGFFQGQGNMRPTSVSQVLEAVFKLLVGLAAAVVIMRMTKNVAYAAGGAILGVTVSCLISAGYLKSRQAAAYRELPRSGDTALGWKATAGELLKIAVPITVGSAGLQLLTVLETKLYMGQLLTANGLSQGTADTLKGIYDMSQTIFNMPCAFIIPITVSIIPAVTEHLTLKRDQQVRETEESAARITGLIALPCAVGLGILARPVMSLLGDYTGEKLQLASQLMMILSAGIFLYSVVQYTNALLQAHGYAHVPVVNMLLAGVAKLGAVYILSGNPVIGIRGAAIGATACYFCISVLNLVSIARRVPQKPRLLRNLVRPLVPAALMGAAVWGVYQLMLHVMGDGGSRLILCGVPIAAGVAVYGVLVVLCKAITREDCRLLPKGDKIARLLRL